MQVTAVKGYSFLASIDVLFDRTNSTTEAAIPVIKIVELDEIPTLRNPFEDVIKNYFSPDGIVIGRNSNPVNQSGGRIIHLRILEK